MDAQLFDLNERIAFFPEQFKEVFECGCALCIGVAFCHKAAEAGFDFFSVDERYGVDELYVIEQRRGLAIKHHFSRVAVNRCVYFRETVGFK